MGNCYVYMIFSWAIVTYISYFHGQLLRIYDIFMGNCYVYMIFSGAIVTYIWYFHGQL